MKVWIVIPGYSWEGTKGYYEPEGVFRNEEQAKQRVTELGDEYDYVNILVYNVTPRAA